MSTEVVVALIMGTFSLLVPVVKWLLDLLRDWMSRPREPTPEPVVTNPPPKPLNWRIPAATTLVGTMIGYVVGLYFAGTFPASVPISPAFQTPVPRGELIMEINFDQPGDGDCNDYDASLLGYENSQYFIQPKSNGYIAICHARDDLAPQGSLEVSAWLEADIENIYGFALLFGWRGEKRDTTDACMFGIRRKGSITEAFYSIRQAGRRKASAPNLRSLALDNARHTLRVVLFPDGQAFGYLDEQLFATYQFEHCSSGPVGMMAWGPGDQKIYFDDLKLFALP